MYKRQACEVTALLKWKPNIDFNSFHRDFIRDDGKRKTGAYGNPLRFSHQKNSIVSYLPWLYLKFDQESQADVNSSTDAIWIVPSDVDVDAVEARINIPSGFWFAGTYDEIDLHGYTVQQNNATVKLIQYIVHTTIGTQGNTRQIRDMIEDIQRQFTKTHESRRQSGSLNNGPLFYVMTGVHGAPMGANLKAPLPVIDQLLIGYSEMKQNSEKLRDDIAVTVHSPYRVLQAYVYQQALNALATKKGLLNVIQAALIAADYVNIGDISIEDAKEAHCLCINNESLTTEHVCHNCSSVRVCCDMTVTDDGLFHCLACARKSTSLITIRTRTVYTRLRKTVNTVYSNERQHRRQKNHPPGWTEQELFAKLQPELIDDTSWRDFYDGNVSINTSHSEVYLYKSPTGRQMKDPYQLSIDNVLGTYIVNARTEFHHPDNVVLTKLCINYLKGRDIPAVMPALKRARRLAKEQATMPLSLGYPLHLQNGYEAIERLADNALVISRFMPYQLQSRLKIPSFPQRLQQWRDYYVPQSKSGIWSGDYPMYGINVPTRASMVSNVQLQQARITWPMWTKAELLQISAVIDAIEASPFFNPYKFKIPRSKTGDNSPWLWRLDLQYRDAGFDFLFAEFRARFRTWDEWCDSNNETVESPLTLLLEYVVQWLATGGGKCPMFGFVMVPLSGHLQSYSFGRARFVVNRSGERQREVRPREMMRSGWVTLSPSPTTIEQDYDYTRRTVVVESWKANTARFDFPPDDTSYARVIDAIDTLADSTSVYDALQPASAYRKVQFPRSWKRTVMRRRHETDLDDSSSSSDVEEMSRDYDEDYSEDDIDEELEQQHNRERRTGAIPLDEPDIERQGQFSDAIPWPVDMPSPPPRVPARQQHPAPSASTAATDKRNRALLAARAAGGQVNPTAVTGTGHWEWLEDDVDQPAAVARQLQTPEAVGIARIAGQLPAGRSTIPAAVWYRDPDQASLPPAPPASTSYRFGASDLDQPTFRLDDPPSQVANVLRTRRNNRRIVSSDTPTPEPDPRPAPGRQPQPASSELSAPPADMQPSSRQPSPTAMDIDLPVPGPATVPSPVRSGTRSGRRFLLPSDPPMPSDPPGRQPAQESDDRHMSDEEPGLPSRLGAASPSGAQGTLADLIDSEPGSGIGSDLPIRSTTRHPPRDTFTNLHEEDHADDYNYDQVLHQSRGTGLLAGELDSAPMTSSSAGPGPSSSAAIAARGQAHPPRSQTMLASVVPPPAAPVSRPNPTAATPAPAPVPSPGPRGRGGPANRGGDLRGGRGPGRPPGHGRGQPAAHVAPLPAPAPAPAPEPAPEPAPARGGRGNQGGNRRGGRGRGRPRGRGRRRG